MRQDETNAAGWWPDARNGSRASRPGAETPLTVYSDGAFPLCTLEFGHHARQSSDGRFAFVDVSASDSDTGNGLMHEDSCGLFLPIRPTLARLAGRLGARSVQDERRPAV